MLKLAPVLVGSAFALACGGSQAAEGPVEPTGDTAADTTSDAKSDDGARLDLGSISIAAPATWKQSEPSSPMRKAQFAIGEAELVVFYFEGGAGSVEDNLTRWHGQFTQPDGSDTAAKAVTKTRTVSGLTVTTTDVSGRYVAAVRPGASEKHDKPGQRLIGAIVETGAGHYYFKLLGPEAAVEAAAADFDALLDSVKTNAPVNPHGGNPHGGNPHGGNPHGGGW